MKLVKKISDSINLANINIEVASKVKLQKHNYVLLEDEEDLYVSNSSLAFVCLNALKNIDFIDYQLYRTNLKEIWGILSEELWSAVDPAIKYEVAANKSCSQNRIKETIPNDRERWRVRTTFAQFAARARRERYEYVKSILIDSVIETPVLMTVMNDMKQYNIESLYVNDGLFGTLFGTVNGVYLDAMPEDYLENAINYIDATTAAWHLSNLGMSNDPIFGLPYGKFESIGLRVKPFTFSPACELTQDEMCNYMIEYLKYGYNKTLIVEM